MLREETVGQGFRNARQRVMHVHVVPKHLDQHGCRWDVALDYSK